MSRHLPGFSDKDSRAGWAGDKLGRSANEGRYLEVRLGQGAVLINIYAHACSSSIRARAEKNALFRKQFLGAVEDRVAVLQRAGVRVVVCGDFNAVDVLSGLQDCAKVCQALVKPHVKFSMPVKCRIYRNDKS